MVEKSRQVLPFSFYPRALRADPPAPVGRDWGWGRTEVPEEAPLKPWGREMDGEC